MLGHTLVSASAALALLSFASAGPLGLLQRTEVPSSPSCSSYTSYKYAGCFNESSLPQTSLVYRTDLPSSGMTIEKCTAFCKGNQYQYAGLEYYGECFCGGTVYGSQVDESYCSFPCDGDKSETCGGDYFISVYQDPTYPVVDKSTIADYQAMGCYTDINGGAGRTLEWQQTSIDATMMTVEKCLHACKNGGYSFAGVEYGQECFCGVVLGNGTMQVDSSQCTMPCTGDSSEICGDSSRLNLYVAKDIEEAQPCTGGSPSAASSSTAIMTSTSSSSSAPSSTSSSQSSSSQSSSSQSSFSQSSSSQSISSQTSTSRSFSSQAFSSQTSSSSSSAPATSKPSSSTVLSTSSPMTTTSNPIISTASLCTSTSTVTAAPICEYKCGSWCSSPIPDFSDAKSAAAAASTCLLQIASCFLQAGFPDSLKCFEFSDWCNNVALFGKNYCPGTSCSKASCKSKYPPTGPAGSVSTSTSIYPCSATTTLSTKTASPTSSSIPVPTYSNVCQQPNNPLSGYSTSSPVGGIALPCLTCNNIYADYLLNPFKLYTSIDSSRCASFKSGLTSIKGACQTACDSQYAICIATYAESCKSNNWWSGLDTYLQAKTKCGSQQADCYAVNSGVSGSGRCGAWNLGW